MIGRVYTLMGPLLGFTIGLHDSSRVHNARELFKYGTLRKAPSLWVGVASRPPSDGASTF